MVLGPGTLGISCEYMALDWVCQNGGILDGKMAESNNIIIIIIIIIMMMMMMMMMIIIMAYTATFPRSCSHLLESELLVHLIGQAVSTREIPLLFEKCCGFFKVPHIGLVEVGRLGHQLNVPTPGQGSSDRR